jgi:hypothetical protein
MRVRASAAHVAGPQAPAVGSREPHRSSSALGQPERDPGHGHQAQRPAAASSWAAASTQPPVVPSARCSRFQNGARVLR